MTTIPTSQLERLLPRLDTLSKGDAQALLAGLASEVNARCAADGLFWLKFVRTRDEADPLEPIKPVPLDYPYVREFWEDVNGPEQQIIMAKSRQMMASWLIAAYAVHWARFKPHQSVYFQTQGWPDAVAMTAMPSGGYTGRMQFIEDNLPVWMKVPYKPSEGRLQYSNGSIIQALAGGANQIRGKTPSLYIADEFAFQEDQDKVYTAVAPLVQKGAREIFISTPNGTNNMFATLYHGRPVGDAIPV